MDPLIVFLCLFLPTFGFTLLGAQRDQMLFETRPTTSRWLVAPLLAVCSVVLAGVGMPLAWVAALILPGPLGSRLGDWVGGGGWIVLRYRIDLLRGRD